MILGKVPAIVKVQSQQMLFAWHNNPPTCLEMRAFCFQIIGKIGDRVEFAKDRGQACFVEHVHEALAEIPLLKSRLAAAAKSDAHPMNAPLNLCREPKSAAVSA